MILNNVLNGKKGFLDNNISFQHSTKMSIFQQELNHDFHKNFKVLLSLKISEKELHVMFNNVQNGKRGFLN